MADEIPARPGYYFGTPEQAPNRFQQTDEVSKT
jgi:hypothetical protein